MRILLFLMCFAPTFVWGQNAFMKEFNRSDYGNYLSSQVRPIIQYNSSYYVLGSVMTGGANQLQRPLFTKIGSDGNIGVVQIDSLYYNACYQSVIGKSDFFYAAGYRTESPTTTNKTKIIRKLDLNGNIIWSKTFGEVAQLLYDNNVGQMYAKDNSIAVLSTSYDGSNTTDLDFTLLNTEGDVISTHLFTVDTTVPYTDVPISSTQTSDGYLVLMEGRNGPANIPYNLNVLLKLDDSGSEQWRLLLNEFPLLEREVQDSIQIATGIFNMKNDHIGVLFKLFKLDSNEQYFVFSKNVIAELDEDGNYIRSSEILKNVDFETSKIETNSEYNVFIFGDYSDEIDFFDVFAAKLNLDFSLVWFNNYGYNQNETFTGADETMDGGSVIIGRKIRYVPPPVGFDYFIVKTDCMGNIEWDSHSCIVPSEEEIVVMGNPMIDHLLIQFPQLSNEDYLEFELINAIGQVVRKRYFSGAIIHENVENLSQGMYLYTVKTSKGNVFTGKLMKQ